MHLEKYSVRGFRSLTNVVDIPVSNPTILAGPNDGGKTAALHALAFLLREYSPTNDDRSYLPEEPGSRCAITEVRGHFRLDQWERDAFELPQKVELRRVLVEDSQFRYEMWAPMPDDEELRHLGSLLVPALKALATKFGIRVPNPTKPKLLSALRAYAAEHSSSFGWAELPAGLEDRLPRLASFEGHTLEPEAAVRSALTLRFKGYVADETVRGQVRELEVAAQDWLCIQAKPLADHIVKRCPDISSVNVEPVVSFAPSLKSTSLHLERSSGERVRLDRSGLGSSRRISMAVWEATSDLLAEQAPVEADLGDAPPPVQIIVVYDEPDTHLDYHYQREVMRLIREQAGVPHVSVVVATHSMNLIDGVDIRDVVLLRLDDDHRTTMQRLGSGDHADFDRHLGMIATAVGLRNSVLLHERCFFAVEGDTEQLVIPILFTLSEGISLQAAGVALWACGGNDGALNLARYLHKHGRSVLLMVDADSQTRNRMFSTQNLQRVFSEDHDDVVVMVGKEQGVDELEEALRRRHLGPHRQPGMATYRRVDTRALRGPPHRQEVQRPATSPTEGAQRGRSGRQARHPVRTGHPPRTTHGHSRGPPRRVPQAATTSRLATPRPVHVYAAVAQASYVSAGQRSVRSTRATEPPVPTAGNAHDGQPHTTGTRSG